MSVTTNLACLHADNLTNVSQIPIDWYEYFMIVRVFMGKRTVRQNNHMTTQQVVIAKLMKIKTVFPRYAGDYDEGL